MSVKLVWCHAARAARYGLVAVAAALLSGCFSAGGGGEDSPPAAASEEPIGTSAVLTNGGEAVAVVGSTYTTSVRVVAVDKRNSVVGYAASNATTGGAAPSITSAGVLSWAPNEADFQNTRSLSITARLATGSAQVVALPVRVLKERSIFSAALPANAGTLADPQGRYLLNVAPAVTGQAMSGTLELVEQFDAAGLFTFYVKAPASAEVTVLDAPSGDSAVNPATVSNAPADRKTTLATTTQACTSTTGAKEAAAPLCADIGAKLHKLLAGNLGLSATDAVSPLRGFGTSIFSTRSASFEFDYSIDGFTYKVRSQSNTRVFQVDGNCWTAAQCTTIAADVGSSQHLAPVILIHGFNLEREVGGGSSTWGSLAASLTAQGRPVFEFRWNTYMRFEEAAGALALLANRVSEISGHKAVLVAHSFGGIVAHVAANNLGIRYTGSAWARVPLNDSVAHILSLDAPLSGIAKSASPALQLPAGRDFDDPLIQACSSITCVQSGASEAYDGTVDTELIKRLKQIDPALATNGMALGQTLRSLHSLKRAGNWHNIPTTVIASIKVGLSSPDAVSAYKLGDGLISLFGQALLPEHFLTSPTAAAGQEGFPSAALGSRANFYSALGSAKYGKVAVATADGVQYRFTQGGAHTTVQDGSPLNYDIARYPLQGTTDFTVPLGTARIHPLDALFFDTDAPLRVQFPASSYAPPPAIHAVVTGRLLRNGVPAPARMLTAQIEEVSTGQAVSDLWSFGSSATDGSFSFDAGAVLMSVSGATASNRSSYRISLTVGDGIESRRVTLRQSLAATVDIGDIELARPAALSSVSGSLIDGQTAGTPIAGANIYFMRGINMPSSLVIQAASITNLAASPTARKVTTDTLGRFSISGIEPGYYSVVAAKTGWITQTQGIVQISSSGATQLSLSLLRQLSGSAASITLRWAGTDAGADVSPDLDAHLLRYTNSGFLDEHVWYNAGTASNGVDKLDRDDRDYIGPETISLTLDSSRFYSYYVSNYLYQSSNLVRSRPTVLLRLPSESWEFTLPAGTQSTARYWRVFDIAYGVVIPCEVNCLTDIDPSTQ